MDVQTLMGEEKLGCGWLRQFLIQGAPRNDAAERLYSEQQAYLLLQHYGILPTRDNIRNAPCRTCAAAMRKESDTRKLRFRLVCAVNKSHKISPTVNTILHEARLHPAKIVTLIHCFLLGFSLTDMKREAKLNTGPAVAWYGRCRDVARKIAWHEFVPLGDDDDVVECDETHIYKEKNHVGRRVQLLRGVWVWGGISRTTKKVFARLVPDRKLHTLLGGLMECIEPGTYLCTDGWRGYFGCDQYFSGHGVVNHSTNFLNPPKNQDPLFVPAGRFHAECLDKQWTGNIAPGMTPFRNHTQNIERAWRSLKEVLPRSCKRQKIEQYIGEWMYRNNILKGISGDNAKFERFLRDIARSYPGYGLHMMNLDLSICQCPECDN